MAHPAYSKNGMTAVNSPLRAVSPKTVAAIVLMALMAVLWLRVLTGGKTGPSAVQAAVPMEDEAAVQTASPLRISPVALPVLEGRNDVLVRDFFSPDNWPAFNAPPAAPPADARTEVPQQKAAFEQLVRTLHLDAILRAGGGLPARVCIDGNVLMQGQTLSLKRGPQHYEITVSEINDEQVVLTWNNWQVVLYMTQPERVD